MLPDYFSERVLKHPGRGCWEWQGPLNNKGYGMMYVREFARRSTSHRASYEFHFGPIPDGLWVLHKCDNPKCLRPSHLFLGTPKDNFHDMLQKGRLNRTTQPRGEDNCNATMTSERVIGLRKDYVAGLPLSDLIQNYGVTERSINDYTGGRSWKHLLGVDGSPTLEQLKVECARRRRNCARLNKETADEIRKRLSAGELGRDLAVEYGVHKATISDIRQNKIWR